MTANEPSELIAGKLGKRPRADGDDSHRRSGLHRAATAASPLVLTLALLVLAGPAPANAQSRGARNSHWPERQTLVLPHRSVAPQGFTAEIVAENLHHFGDVPLEVHLHPVGPSFAEDRHLTFRLNVKPRSAALHNREVSYQFSVAVAAGSGPVQQRFYLPKWVLGGEFDVVVLEAGQPLEGYAGEIGAGGTRDAAWEAAWLQSAQGRFCWIADPGAVALGNASAAEQVEDLRVLLAALAPELLAIEPMSHRDTALLLLRQYGTAAGLDYRTAEQVPEDWRGVGNWHVWITRWSTYRWLAEHRPEAERALRQFVRCGGALWLVDVDRATLADHFASAWDPADFGADDAAAAQAAAGAPASGLAAAGPAIGPDARRGEIVRGAAALPRLDQLGPQARGFGVALQPRRELQEQAASLHLRSQPSAVALENLAWLAGQQGSGVGDEVFALQLGIGLIVGCSVPAETPLTFTHWRRMQEQSAERLSSVLTRGFDPVAGDSRFWRWVIPGVAQPPVYTFIGLLAGFVILVGPVAYRKLTRMGRGYLMFFVAPVLAALTTVLLFGYGLIADGLGTQGRVRQITVVGDRDGGALRYWRSTYFAGLQPSGGLSFPADAHVEPYHHEGFYAWTGASAGEGGSQGTIALGDDALRLSSGFLPSRQQRQFVAYRPLEQIGGLRWQGGEVASTARVHNGFDFPLRDLILRSPAGDYWTVAAVPAGAEAEATPVTDSAAVAGALTALYARNRLEAPPGMQLGGSGNRPTDLASLLATSEPWRNTAVSQRVSGGDGVLEWWLQNALQTQSSLRPGTFIGLSDVTPDCIAVQGAELVQSIHYVLGDLQ